jgi:hypothetical protein
MKYEGKSERVEVRKYTSNKAGQSMRYVSTVYSVHLY